MTTSCRGDGGIHDFSRGLVVDPPPEVIAPEAYHRNLQGSDGAGLQSAADLQMASFGQRPIDRLQRWMRGARPAMPGNVMLGT